MKSRRRNNGENRLVSEINVTPLVDVILVLLIIFMVTAPMLQMGMDINLPEVKAKAIDVSEEKIILNINGNREIFINNYKTTLPELGVKLESIFKSPTRPKPTRMSCWRRCVSRSSRPMPAARSSSWAGAMPWPSRG